MSLKHATLDFSGCQSLHELHTRIKEALHFPAYYGMNLDAFWDLLWSECDADKVIIRGEHTLTSEFYEYRVKLHEILERNIAFRGENKLNPFSYEIID